MSTLAIKLTRDAERQLRSGHPWVYQKSIIKQSKDGKPGDICIIFSHQSNQMIAIGLLDPSSPIRIKILDLGKNIQLDHSFWYNKVRHAFNLRKPLFKTDTNAYRLIFGENDGFPGLIADVYDRIIVIKLYSMIWQHHLPLVVDALQKIVAPKGIILRLARKMENNEAKPQNWKNGTVLYGSLPHEEVRFREHGVIFETNLIKGHKTGFFLDHRHNRYKIGKMSKGKSVLDVFSYAGGFTVHALVGGAKVVTSMDSSAKAQEMANRNVMINNVEGQHNVIIGDAFFEIAKLISQKQKYDIVIIDPPSFASKKNQIPAALSSYRKLIQLGSRMVTERGILMMASCSSRIKPESFFALIDQTLAGNNWKCIEKTGHDIDHPVTFPQGEYLKSGYYMKY